MTNYWDNFYSNNGGISQPSPFCVWCANIIIDRELKRDVIVDVGCGNGRDISYFNDIFPANVCVGLDSSKNAVKLTSQSGVIAHQKNVCKDSVIWLLNPDIVYCRFLLHAVEYDLQEKLLNNIFACKCTTFLEFRLKDNNEKYYHNNHKRYTVDNIWVCNYLNNLNIAYEMITGYGLAKYYDEDPLITRIIAYDKN